MWTGVKIAFPEPLTFMIDCTICSRFSIPQCDHHIFFSTKLMSQAQHPAKWISRCILSDTYCLVYGYHQSQVLGICPCTTCLSIPGSKGRDVKWTQWMNISCSILESDGYNRNNMQRKMRDPEMPEWQAIGCVVGLREAAFWGQHVSGLEVECVQWTWWSPVVHCDLNVYLGCSPERICLGVGLGWGWSQEMGGWVQD